MKRSGFIVQFLMGLIIFTGIAILAGSVGDQMYFKNAYFEVKNLTDKAALAAAKNYQTNFDEQIAIAAARNISANNKVFGQDLKDELVFTFDEAHTRVTATLPHFSYKTFWLRAVGLKSLDINNVYSVASIVEPLSSQNVAPFLINKGGLKPRDSISLTFSGAGVNGADYDPTSMTKFYPVRLDRDEYFDFEQTGNNFGGNGSVEKVARYSNNIIFGSEKSVSTGDAILLENDNNPAFGNVNSLLNSLDNGFPNFFNNDSVYAATFVSLEALKLRTAGTTSEVGLASALNKILSELNAKNDWPKPYIAEPLDSKPELYIMVSDGTKTIEDRSAKTVVKEIIKVRLDSLIVNKPSNKPSSQATVEVSFTVLNTPPRLIE